MHNPIHQPHDKRIKTTLSDPPVMEQQRWFGLGRAGFQISPPASVFRLCQALFAMAGPMGKSGETGTGAGCVIYYVMHEFDQGDVNTLLIQAEQFPTGLREDTMTIAQQLEQGGLQKGLQQGIQQGLEEGQARGLQKRASANGDEAVTPWYAIGGKSKN